MKLKAFFQSLSPEAQEAYARRAGTTANYIRVHLICSPPRRVPRPALIQGLSMASKGQVSRDELLKHFYPDLYPLEEKDQAA